jgi:hypothetical protein
MTDTPPAATHTPVPAPPSRLEAVKAFMGDMARPFAIYSTALATSYAIWTREAGEIGAAGLILSALYAGKVIENATQSVQTAKVETAKVRSDATAQAASKPLPRPADDPALYSGPRE